MILSAGAVAGSALSEQPRAEPKTPSRRRITAVADQQSEPEAR